MAKWEDEIDLSDFYHQYEVDGNFVQYATKVIAKLTESGLFESAELQQLQDACDADDVDEWDIAWSDIYDFADEHRIWLRVLA